MIESIISNQSFDMVIKASKPWPTSKRKDLNEKNKSTEDEGLILEMKYPSPNLSCLLYPQNKPTPSGTKISIKELTEKRAESVVSYLSKITEGMPIKIVGEGIGYKKGDPSISILIKESKILGSR